ncbi:hypothetical protein DUI87_24776 [Hirundo rustica rustica]|uniref:Uncharacterized protein n=1 Tax=Hirundo rustica rustica TaxID=333673 RepID=A0A3M0JE01_HIRRU|nr:hypothetical protein DUI87_24776 [Hirundo rustica rustica]
MVREDLWAETWAGAVGISQEISRAEGLGSELKVRDDEFHSLNPEAQRIMNSSSSKRAKQINPAVNRTWPHRDPGITAEPTEVMDGHIPA